MTGSARHRGLRVVMPREGRALRGTLHQVLITTPGAPFPEEYHEKRAEIRAQFTEYRLWTGPDIEDFLREQYGATVLEAYLTLRPYAYRADLARYCIVHHYGGWYVDYGIRSLALPQAVDDVDLIAFRDRQEHSGTSWALQNGLFYARKGLPALGTAVDLVLANIEARYYGITPLSPTGPSVFGQAVAIHGERQETALGSYIDLTPMHDRDNLAYVGGDGWIWAAVKDEPPGFLAVDGSNHYGDLWWQRLVYGEGAASTD